MFSASLNKNLLPSFDVTLIFTDNVNSFRRCSALTEVSQIKCDESSIHVRRSTVGDAKQTDDSNLHFSFPRNPPAINT